MAWSACLDRHTIFSNSLVLVAACRLCTMLSPHQLLCLLRHLQHPLHQQQQPPSATCPRSQEQCVCVFPFVYEGANYSACISPDGSGSRCVAYHDHMTISQLAWKAVHADLIVLSLMQMPPLHSRDDCVCVCVCVCVCSLKFEVLQYEQI